MSPRSLLELSYSSEISWKNSTLFVLNDEAMDNDRSGMELKQETLGIYRSFLKDVVSMDSDIYLVNVSIVSNYFRCFIPKTSLQKFCCLHCSAAVL